MATFSIRQTAAPASEPVTVAEARDWVRVSGAAHDATLATLIAAATRAAEGHCSRQFVTASWELRLDRFPYPGGWELLVAPAHPPLSTIRLPRGPLRSVASVKYLDMTGTEQTLAPSAYDVDTASDPGRVCLAMGKVWPVTRPAPGAVRVAYESGYGAAADVPADVKLAMLLTVGHLFENREGVVLGTIATEIPRGAQSLLDGFRCWEMGYGL